MPASSAVILTRFAGRAGDHNDRAMSGSVRLADALAARLDQDVVTIGVPRPALSVGWAEELAAATPELSAMAAHYERLYASGRTPITALSRCAVALATLPVVAAHRPDAAMAVLAADEVEGVEVGEFESGPDDTAAADRLVSALDSLFPR